MSANTGDNAHEGGDFMCVKYHQTIQLGAGDVLPKCPNCDGEHFPWDVDLGRPKRVSEQIQPRSAATAEPASISPFGTMPRYGAASAR